MTENFHCNINFKLKILFLNFNDKIKNLLHKMLTKISSLLVTPSLVPTFYWLILGLYHIEEYFPVAYTRGAMQGLSPLPPGAVNVFRLQQVLKPLPLE